MDIKLKKFSHSIVTKIIVFIITILCFLGIIRSLVEIEMLNNQDFTSLGEDHYLESEAYILENEQVIIHLLKLLNEYKNEDFIMDGGSISEEEMQMEKEILFENYIGYSDPYQEGLYDPESNAKFNKEYADEIAQAKDKLIRADLRNYHALLQQIDSYEEPLFFATDGKNTFTNTNLDERKQFESFPAYMIFEGYKQDIHPVETKDSSAFYWITEAIHEQDLSNMNIYLAFSEAFLEQKTKEWQETKTALSKSLSQIVGFSIGFILSLFYLVLVIGRKSFKDQKLHFHAGDKIYNDMYIILTMTLLFLYAVVLDDIFHEVLPILVPILIPMIVLTLFLFLTLVKQVKNKSLFTHTLIFVWGKKLAQFIGDVYHSGGVARKTVLLVVGYPILIALTFFMFPVTIGAAAWFTLRRVKSFQAIQDGVETIKDGNLNHRINIQSTGEFGKLATNINSITAGLNKAVDNELKSERLKTELITNVSHDIRTPLTSIITYVDLLKNETDSEKRNDYIEVLDQKSKRLKTLTDDLFDAAKATSGNIPVHFEKIDIVSLITQGLGEVSDKIEAHDLDFRVSYPEERMYLNADGKLLWRSFENVLSNIFKYSLHGSRVYLTIEDRGKECLITFKNISAYELNISPDELMERFKRGDESRSSQGSGLGLSIAKSLIEIQSGRFQIDIDGDLFKAMIYLPKHPDLD